MDTTQSAPNADGHYSPVIGAIDGDGGSIRLAGVQEPNIYYINFADFVKSRVRFVI